MKTTCEFTGEEMTIVTMCNLDDRLWRFLDAKGLKLHIARSCIPHCDGLLRKFGDMELYKETDPKDYLNCLYNQALEANPHLREMVEYWFSIYERPYSIHPNVQP